VYQCVSEKVAVHGWSATRARDEVYGVGQRTTEVGVVVGRVCLDLEELVVGQHSRCEGSSCYSHYSRYSESAWAATPSKA
jgi:hypothetical protein